MKLTDVGAFDYVRCRYRLPDPEAQDLVFQTKSMPAPLLDNYEVTEDGRLLHEAYDARVEENADAPLGAWVHRENLRWEPVDFRGELEIHTVLELPGQERHWCSYLLWFRDGRVTDAQPGSGHKAQLPVPSCREPP